MHVTGRKFLMIRKCSLHVILHSSLTLTEAKQKEQKTKQINKKQTTTKNNIDNVGWKKRVTRDEHTSHYTMIEVHIKGINMLPSFLLQSRVIIVMIKIIITATSPPITPTYGPLDEDSVFAVKKRKTLKHVPK